MNNHINKTKPQDVVILIDIDDVLTYFVPAWVKWLNDKYGLDVRYEDIIEWEVAKFFPTLTPEQVFEPLGTREFCESVQVRPDAVEYVKKLYDVGYQIYLCTATNYHNIKDKYEVIQEELDIWKRKYNLLMHQHDMYVYETKKRGNAVYKFLPIFRGKDLGTDVIDMMIEIGKPVKAVELAMAMPYSEHEILGALSDGAYQGLVMKDDGAWVVTDEARDLWESE